MKYINIQMGIIINLLIITVLFLLSSCSYKESNYEIMFSDNHSDIYQIKDDGKNYAEQLTFSPEIGEYYLMTSESGENIIFYAKSKGVQFDSNESIELNKHIYLLNTEEKKLDDITEIFIDFDFGWYPYTIDWSYDQSKFAVIRYDGQEREINSYLDVIDFSGIQKQHFPIQTFGNIPALVDDAIWSPDGEKILLSQMVIGVDEQAKYPGSLLFIYFLNDGRTVQLSNYEDNCYLSSWSPTNKQIVSTCSFISSNGVSNNDGKNTIRIFNTEDEEQLYEYIGYSPCEYPSWSPDGKQISFVCENKKGQNGIFIINSDGSEFHELDIEDIENFRIYQGPHWSPDGTKIIYVAFLSEYDASHSMIYSVNIDGSDNHAITIEEGQYIVEAVYPIN
jgi:Tol biopolymer transport system component